MASPLDVRIRGDANINLVVMAAMIRNLPNIVSPRLVPKICFNYPSVRAEEYFVHVNAVPKARKWTEERAGGMIASIKQTVTNDTYEVSLGISGDDWQDDQIGLYTPLAQEVMTSLILAADELVVDNLITKAYSPGIACFDGANFYATTHAWPNGEYTTSQVNYNGGTGVSDAGTIETDFYTALAAMQSWKDDRGRPKMYQQAFMDPNNLIVHHSIAVQGMMQAVFDTDKSGAPFNMPVGTTNTTTFRQSRACGMAVRVPDPHLTGNTWYLHFTGGPMLAQKPFVFLDREAPSVVIFSKGSEHYEKYNEVLILGKRRFGLGVLRPECSQMIYNA